eukprot:363272-Chlamydomonas_euryale.AAC.8
MELFGPKSGMPELKPIAEVSCALSVALVCACARARVRTFYCAGVHSCTLSVALVRVFCHAHTHAIVRAFCRAPMAATSHAGTQALPVLGAPETCPLLYVSAFAVAPPGSPGDIQWTAHGVSCARRAALAAELQKPTLGVPHPPQNRAAGEACAAPHCVQNAPPLRSPPPRTCRAACTAAAPPPPNSGSGTPRTPSGSFTWEECGQADGRTDREDERLDGRIRVPARRACCRGASTGRKVGRRAGAQSGRG